MRKISISFILLLLCSTIAYAQDGLVFEPAVWDFGEIREADGPVSHTFTGENRSGKPLVILDVVTSCGCTVPRFSKQPILSGGKTEITVTYDPTNRPGVFSKELTVYSSDRKKIATLTVHGTVTPRPKSIEELYPIDAGGGLRRLLARIGRLKILSRARPLDKQRLVRLLQQQGEVVAVTGDGTNDAPALNFANVGLSMGSGTSVAKDASDITLLDDSFRSIATAVLWGRSLYRNIQRFILFQLTINFAAIIVFLAGSLMETEMPLTVTQILWVNIIMDTLAAMAMASLPPQHEVMRERPRHRDESIVSRAMIRTIATCGSIFVVVLLGMLGWWLYTTGEPTIRQLTVFFTTFVFLQLWNLFNAKGFEAGHPALHGIGRCRTFLVVLLLITIGQWIIVEFGGEVFRTVPLTWQEWAWIIGLTSLIAWGGEAVRAIGRRHNRCEE